MKSDDDFALGLREIHRSYFSARQRPLGPRAVGEAERDVVGQPVVAQEQRQALGVAAR